MEERQQRIIIIKQQTNKPGVMYLNRKKTHNIHTHIKGVTIRKKQR